MVFAIKGLLWFWAGQKGGELDAAFLLPPPPPRIPSISLSQVSLCSYASLLWTKEVRIQNLETQSLGPQLSRCGILNKSLKFPGPFASTVKQRGGGGRVIITPPQEFLLWLRGLSMGSSCSSDSVPGPGTSICWGCWWKKKKIQS